MFFPLNLLTLVFWLIDARYFFKSSAHVSQTPDRLFIVYRIANIKSRIFSKFSIYDTILNSCLAAFLFSVLSYWYFRNISTFTFYYWLWWLCHVRNLANYNFWFTIFKRMCRLRNWLNAWNEKLTRQVKFPTELLILAFTKILFGSNRNPAPLSLPLLSSSHSHGINSNAERVIYLWLANILWAYPT